MIKKFVLAMILTAASFISTTALAKHYIECGVTADDRTGIVKGFELAIYVEDRGQFKGFPGDYYQLLLENPRQRWIQNDRSIEAQSSRIAGLEVVEIQLNKTATRPVGIRYKLVDLWSSTPTLEKYEFGGFARPKFIASFECLRTVE